jgi:LysR family transcriptional regulator, benzoate and cis,cis-muconate-responsive activator of ben and cat genes
VELRHLRYFVAVAEMENVSRAALKLHVSQPALSRQIRDLEDELGFSLLERTAKSVRLTDPGRAFLDNARALLQNADEAVTKARAVASAETTELHVGYSPTPTAEILPKAITGISRGDAKRARQIARFEQQRHSRRDTRWPASTRIDRSSREG